jgi:hypothetical protein
MMAASQWGKASYMGAFLLVLDELPVDELLAFC